MKRYSYYMFFMIVAIISCLAFIIINKSYALPDDKAKIVNAHNEIDVAKYSKADANSSYIEVNTETGKTNKGSFNDLAEGKSFDTVIEEAEDEDSKKEIIIDYLNEDGKYAVKDNDNDNSLEILPIYANKRIRVNTSKTYINTYNAKSGVRYNDYYILSYNNETDTKYAYENLIADFGKNNVIIDLPLDSKEIKGWGTNYMSFNKKLLNINPNNNIIVAVLDSGIDRTHEIFNNIEVLDGINVINSSLPPNDDFGHGTSVSGIIAESVGNANVSILPIKVLNERGTGSLLNVLNSLDYAEKQGARVANMSLALNFADYYSNNALANTMMAYEKIISTHSLFMVCASGNNNLNQDNAYSYPSISNYTISVGSITKNETKSSFSNYGTTLDFVAPGTDINVAKPTAESCTRNCYKVGSGTSFATPYVSAAAALTLVDHPEYQNKTIKNYLISISKDLGAKSKDIYYGYGVPIFKDNDKDFNDEKFIENYNIYLSNSNYTYDGSYKKPKVTLKDEKNNIINPSNYKVAYSNNLNAGIALISVTGTGDYYGTKTATFRVNKAKISGNIHLDKKKYNYTGKEIKPTVTLKDSRGVVISKKNYSVSYKENKYIGTASVMIKGKRNYNNYIYKNFKIVPKKVKISSIKTKSKKLKLNWTKVKSSPTYQIEYKKGKSKWKTKYTNNTHINLRIKKNNTYYIKVRAYKKIANKRYNGHWSQTYKIKL